MTFTPTPWKPVRPLGAILCGKAATLHISHIKNAEHGREAVELRMTYRHAHGEATERLLRIDRSAIPALIKVLEKLA
jgi:hypothetical protein